MNNTPQARVLRAISRGARLTDVIAAKAGLSQDEARTCLTRLREKGYVRSIKVGGRRKAYEPVGVTCMLAEVWK